MIADAARWPFPSPIPADQEEADRYAERILREAVERIPDDIPVTKVLRRGRPGHEIVAYASDSSFDAILLGARGVGRVEALVGSVSQHVMHHASIAVFVAHTPSEGEAAGAQASRA